jgi:HEAT repeat protein
MSVGKGILSVILVGAMCMSCARAAPDEANLGERVRSEAAAADPPTLDSRTQGWALGQWYAYDLKLRTSVKFGEGANVFDFDLAGLVQITPTSVTPDVATLFVALANPKIVSRVPGSEPEFDKVAAQLASTGTFFTFSGGRLVEMRAPHGLPSTAATIYREIACAFQFARTKRPSDRYTAEEYDTTGQYEAEYTFDQSRGIWHKQKLRYTAILAAKTMPANVPGRLVPQVDQSDGDIRLFSDGRAQRIDLRNRVSVSGAQQPVHSSTSISLEVGPSEPARQPAPDWNALMSRMDRTGADDPPGAKAPIESLDKARIAGMTFEKAVARFEEIAKEDRKGVVSSINGAALDADEKARQEQRTQEESRLFLALSAILREQPEAVSKAIQKIKTGSPAADVLIEALSAASNAKTEGVLVDLLNSKGTDPGLRDRIVMALTRTPRPEQRAIDTLKGLLKKDPFSESALLGLGTYSRRLRESDAVDQANEIGALLVDRLRSADNTEDRLTVLRAISNSGYSPAMPLVIPFLTDRQELVRIDAVQALQSMKDVRVDEILIERLNSDPSRDVRISALGAAKVREPSEALAHAVETAAQREPDSRVRFRAVELLAAWGPSRPDVRSTLEQIARNDVEARIRDLARNAL